MLEFFLLLRANSGKRVVRREESWGYVLRVLFLKL
jgi:hypothetical protein